MQRLTDRAHDICRAALQTGDVAIDATVGNGYDTIFLAESVGVNGRVYGFDIQPSAIKSARENLGSKLRKRVTLIQRSHVEMDHCIEESDRNHVKVIMFNLGYLPGGDKEITTRTESTLAAIQIACDLLHPKGLISIIAYPGHEAGKAETDAVFSFLDSLDTANWKSETIQAVENSETAPRWIGLRQCGS